MPKGQSSNEKFCWRDPDKDSRRSCHYVISVIKLLLCGPQRLKQHKNNEREEETIVIGEKMYDTPLCPSYLFIFHPTSP